MRQREAEEAGTQQEAPVQHTALSQLRLYGTWYTRGNTRGWTRGGSERVEVKRVCKIQSTRRKRDVHVARDLRMGSDACSNTFMCKQTDRGRHE